MATLLAELTGTSGIIETITGMIGTLFYPLFCIIFLLIDGVQNVFYAFAGIGDSSHNGTPIYAGLTGDKDQQGLLYYLLHHEIVKNLLISMMLLGLFLVIIFTTMAFIKNVYSAKPKGWKDIVGNAIKGLTNFIVLPICVLLGVWGGNIILQAINGATSYGGSSTMARKLFVASAYNANIYRNSNGGINDSWSINEEEGRNDVIIGYDPNASREQNAYLKVKYFAEYYGLADELNIQEGQSLEYYAEKVDEMFSYDRIFLGSHFQVGRFYNLYQINYIILIVGGIFMLYVLGSISFAMIKRLFYILMLFIVSPGVCAMYPIDEGNAVKSWSGEVKKQVLSAYGAVAGMNLFYSLLPLVDKIGLYADVWGQGWGLNEIIQIFIFVTGLLVIKDLIGLLSGFVGGDNALATGSSLMKSAAKEVGGRAGKYIAGATGAFSRARSAGKSAAAAGGFNNKAFWGSIGSSAGHGLLNMGSNITKTLTGGAVDFSGIKKAWDEGDEKGVKEVEDKALANAVKKISEDIKRAQEEKARSGDEAAYNKKLGDIMKDAKKAGVEGKIANMLAAQLNAAEMERTNMGKTGLPTKYTGEGLLADIKAQGELEDAMKNLTSAMEKLEESTKDAGALIANNRFSARQIHDLGGEATVIERLKQRRAFSEDEINSTTDKKIQNAMIHFNSQVEVQREMVSDYKSALSAVQTATTAVGKASYGEYKSALKGAPGEADLSDKQALANLMETMKGYIGDSSVAISGAVARLESAVTAVGNVTAKLNDKRADVARTRAKDLSSSSGGGSKK